MRQQCKRQSGVSEANFVGSVRGSGQPSLLGSFFGFGFGVRFVGVWSVGFVSRAGCFSVSGLVVGCVGFGAGVLLVRGS